MSGRVTCSWVFALVRDGGFGLWLVFIISSVLGFISESWLRFHFMIPQGDETNGKSF